MKVTLRYIGLDVHKDTIVIAIAKSGRSEARVWKTIPYDLPRLVRAVRLLGEPGELVICYEAGPTGFGVQRALQAADYECQVVAPSLTPVKSGNRVKTDLRDAKTLAHFLRSGDLAPITTPDEEREALRDLERSRDDAKRSQHVARQQLGKFLLRHDLRCDKGVGPWTKKHLAWLGGLKLEHPAAQAVLNDYVKTYEDAAERVERLSQQLEELILQSSLAPLTKGLMALRGVAIVTSASVAAEIGDFRRFGTAQQFMSYVGLTPSEHSSGASIRRGSITKCGNQHVRRLLVEAAQHYRRTPRMSQAIRKRNEGLPPEVQKIAWEAQKRLHKRLYALTAKGKHGNKAICAVARELAGFVWAIGHAVQKEVA